MNGPMHEGELSDPIEVSSFETMTPEQAAAFAQRLSSEPQLGNRLQQLVQQHPILEARLLELGIIPPTAKPTAAIGSEGQSESASRKLFTWGRVCLVGGLVVAAFLVWKFNPPRDRSEVSDTAKSAGDGSEQPDSKEPAPADAPDAKPAAQQAQQTDPAADDEKAADTKQPDETSVAADAPAADSAKPTKQPEPPKAEPPPPWAEVHGAHEVLSGKS